MYSAASGWNVLYIFIKFIWYNVSFKARVSLPIFCLDDLSIDVSGVLKSPTIIVLLSISTFMSVNICFMHLGAPMWVHMCVCVCLCVSVCVCVCYSDRKSVV